MEKEIQNRGFYARGFYASEARKLPSVPAKISYHSPVKEMVPEDSCSDGIRLCVSKNNREIPD
jgi:hypothetical protein